MPSLRPALQSLPYTALALLAYHLYTVRSSTSPPSIIPSPLASVSLLPPSSQADLPYPPSCLPGSRDIPTPYGSIRAYEFGPPTGPRVLFIHGISTPCISLASLAHGLASAGHRVLLFDLPGRGYSASPRGVRHDMRLFASTVGFVLGSSEVHWRRFTVVGYSLGGGVGMAFASLFPDMVERLVLIAPSGLIREARMGWASKLMKSGLLPAWAIEAVVRRRLVGGAQQRTDPEVTHPALKKDSDASLFKDRPGVRVADAVAWQVRENRGFVAAFISSIAYAPITGEHATWRAVGERMDRERREGGRGKVLLVLGKTDEVIVGEELVEDATEVVGKEGLQVEWIDAGHDVPIVKAEEVSRLVAQFCHI